MKQMNLSGSFLLRRVVMIVLVMLMGITNIHADSTIINGIMYVLNKKALEATIERGYPYKPKGRLEIPETIVSGKMSYKVTAIADKAFHNCTKLTHVSLPPTIRSIGAGAFRGCTQLVRVSGIFSNAAVAEDAFAECPLYKASFSEVANNYVLPKIKDWQQKREYETTAQYQERVTKENQERKIQELMQEVIQSYIKKDPLEVTINSYDADYEIYILDSNYGRKFVKVPKSEAQTFKTKFDEAVFNASYIATEKGPKLKDISITLNNETYNSEKIAEESALNALYIDLPEVEIHLADDKPAVVSTPKMIDRSIDQNIPTGIVRNNNTFAVIIGNEKYAHVAQVPYASNDAKVFAEYCKKTLGMPAKNVRIYNNATFGSLLAAMNNIRELAEAYSGELNIIFYYAGHGMPDEKSKDAYILPVDATGLQIEACYPVSRLYKELGEIGARNVVVFMDACFSGAQRGEGMLASARGVALKVKTEKPRGNTIVFSAATGDETAYPYQEKGHGIFTYFLLKKLRETKGDCTLGELGEYIQTNVRQQSVVINGKSQTPTVVPSAEMVDSWRDIKLK